MISEGRFSENVKKRAKSAIIGNTTNNEDLMRDLFEALEGEGVHYTQVVVLMDKKCKEMMNELMRLSSKTIRSMKYLIKEKETIKEVAKNEIKSRNKVMSSLLSQIPQRNQNQVQNSQIPQRKPLGKSNQIKTSDSIKLFGFNEKSSISTRSIPPQYLELKTKSPK